MCLVSILSIYRVSDAATILSLRRYLMEIPKDRPVESRPALSLAGMGGIVCEGALCQRMHG